MHTHADGPVVIGGASGFIGRALGEHYREQGREVLTIGRSGADLLWSDTANIANAVNGASLVIGLAGKNVNCRYTAKNRREIFNSRRSTTEILRNAISSAATPPPLWINASSATIYRHAEDRTMTEDTGEIGEGFSVEVVKDWEDAFFHGSLANTRRVALRSTIVLGDGSVMQLLARLARLGMGGTQLDGWWPSSPRRRRAGIAHERGARGGAQKFSWVHLDDFVRAVDFIEQHEALDGPVNVASPNPSDNRTFMRIVREHVGARVHFPMPRWIQEIGAFVLRTETELTLKSRWVLPGKLLEAGFEFQRPDLRAAVQASVPTR